MSDELEVKSTHRAEVFRISEIFPHPNADRLEVIHFFGYSCAVRKDDFQPGDLAVYIPPDSLVPVARPEFEWLADKAYGEAHRYSGFARIRAQRLRGHISQGLIIPAPSFLKEGDDAAPLLGIKHYDPPEDGSFPGVSLAADSEPGPKAHIVQVYDLENFYRYNDIFIEGENVIVTEKIHGANFRCFFDGDRFWVGSRRQWKKNVEGSIWWTAFNQCPYLAEVCKLNPNVIFYGELYGWVQDLRYGHAENEVSLAFFDAAMKGQLASVVERELNIVGWISLPLAPLIYAGPFKSELVDQWANGQTLVQCPNGRSNIREGCVIEPREGRWDSRIGRVKLKAVSADYLARAK